MLHQRANQPAPVGAAYGADAAAQEGLGLGVPGRQRLHVQAALAQVGGVVRRASHGNAPLAQEALAGPVQVVEMVVLAVRDQAMGSRNRCRTVAI